MIQINPQLRSGEPKLMDDIRDRRNELSGNISFDQEIFFIGQMNKLIQEGMLTEEARKRYQVIKIRVITMSDRVASRLDYESKLSRSPALIKKLLAHGEERGRSFLERIDGPDADQTTAPLSGTSGDNGSRQFHHILASYFDPKKADDAG